jgi:hypothetical protein
MRQHPQRDSWGIQAGKGSGWGKGGRNKSHKKEGLRSRANVMSWDKYGYWSQGDGAEIPTSPLPVWLWTDYLTSLGSNYYICRKKGINRTILKVFLPRIHQVPGS